MPTNASNHAIRAFRPGRSLLGAALLPALLAGCILTEERGGPAGGKDLPAGMTDLASLEGASAAVVLGDRVYVANAAGDALGIAVAEIATGRIVDFHAQDLPPRELAASGDSLVVAAGTDYTAGALSLLNVRTSEWRPAYKAVHSDLTINSQGDRVFLMERSLGVVTGFRQGLLEEGNVFLNVNTGNQTNPYQAVLQGGKAFIVRYGSAHLLVLDADRRDGGTRDSIDLSAWAADSLKGKPGALPHMAAAAAYDGKVFVVVQRLTGWEPRDTSMVLIIDAEARKVTGSVPLLRRNPVAAAALGRYLYVACVEGYGTYTGAVERIDMQEGRHAGLVVEEEDLVPPSDLKGFVPVDDSRGYAIHNPDFSTGLISEIGMPLP